MTRTPFIVSVFAVTTLLGSYLTFAQQPAQQHPMTFFITSAGIGKGADLVPTLKAALAEDTVSIIDCPVDYSENMKLTQRLKDLRSPL